MRYDKFCLRGVRFLIREPGTENAVVWESNDRRKQKCKF